MSQYTPEQITALAEAMDQLLDDMGKDRTSVCLFSKAQARVAFEPFLDPECAEYIMPLDEALEIMRRTGFPHDPAPPSALPALSTTQQE